MTRDRTADDLARARALLARRGHDLVRLLRERDEARAALAQHQTDCHDRGAIREDHPEMNPDHLLVLDDDGTPKAFVDVDTIQSQAVRLAYDMAAACHDDAELDAVVARHLDEAGTGAFGYVTAAALRMVVRHVLDPVLDVTDALHDHGRGPLQHDLRAGLADAAANARRSLT